MMKKYKFIVWILIFVCFSGVCLEGMDSIGKLSFDFCKEYAVDLTNGDYTITGINPDGYNFHGKKMIVQALEAFEKLFGKKFNREKINVEKHILEFLAEEIKWEKTEDFKWEKTKDFKSAQSYFEYLVKNKSANPEVGWLNRFTIKTNEENDPLKKILQEKGALLLLQGLAILEKQTVIDGASGGNYNDIYRAITDVLQSKFIKNDKLVPVVILAPKRFYVKNDVKNDVKNEMNILDSVRTNFLKIYLPASLLSSKKEGESLELVVNGKELSLPINQCGYYKQLEAEGVNHTARNFEDVFKEITKSDKDASEEITKSDKDASEEITESDKDASEEITESDKENKTNTKPTSWVPSGKTCAKIVAGAAVAFAVAFFGCKYAPSKLDQLSNLIPRK